MQNVKYSTAEKKAHFKLLTGTVGALFAGVEHSAAADPRIRRRASAYAASRSSSVLIGFAAFALQYITSSD